MDEAEFIVTGDVEEFNRKRKETGVYDVTTTSAVRYTDPQSYASTIYDHLSGRVDWSQDTYRILDIGASSGEALDTLVNELERETSANFESYALDIDAEMMYRCYEKEHAEPIQAKAQQIPLQNNSIDVVISNHLNLVPRDIEKVVNEIDRVMKPSGIASLATGYDLPKSNYSGFHQGHISK